MKEAVVHSENHVDPEVLMEAIAEECGEKAASFIETHVDFEDAGTLITSTVTRFNILRQPDKQRNTIVNLRRVNDIRYLNKFFESVNHKLPNRGLLSDVLKRPICGGGGSSESIPRSSTGWCIPWITSSSVSSQSSIPPAGYTSFSPGAKPRPHQG